MDLCERDRFPRIDDKWLLLRDGFAGDLVLGEGNFVNMSIMVVLGMLPLHHNFLDFFDEVLLRLVNLVACLALD